MSEDKRQQVVALGRLGWSLRQIEGAMGVRRETAKKYLAEAGVVTRPPRGRSVPNPASNLATDSGPATGGTGPPPPARSGPDSSCEPHRDVITQALERGRNAMSIWQELVDERGFKGAYNCVKRFVRRLRGARTPAARAVIETPPGQEAQVDYGDGPMVRDDRGQYRRTRLFVMTLGCSRKSVRLLTFRSSARIWAELHEQAFRRLGGATRVVVLDNLREGVLRADWYDPTLNPLYRDVLAHYGAIALPCRVRDPDRKGKVESGVGHAQKTPLKGKRFESLIEAQTYLDRWETHWADTRIHGTTKRQVAAMYAEEKPALLPLPIEPFRYYNLGERTVHLDGCVEVESAYYSVPPGWIGHRLPVQWDDRHIRILEPGNGRLLREHLRQERGRHRIRPEDRAPNTPPGTQALLVRAKCVGPNVGILCRTIFDREGEVGIRRILGVMALGKKHGPLALESACATALEWGVANYRFVRRFIERQPPPSLALRQIDPIIRKLTDYRDLINRMTGETT